jgi:hypothetical protein
MWSDLWLDERASFVETLIEIMVIAMGVVGIAVGILSGMRKLGGRVRGSIENVDPGNLGD